MAESRGGLVAVVVVLVAALVLVFFLWQRDQESKDLDIDVGLAAPAAAPLRPATAGAERLVRADAHDGPVTLFEAPSPKS